MMVEKVPDSTYENVGGLDKQIKEIKEVIELPVKHPELFDALGIAQPKVCVLFSIVRSCQNGMHQIYGSDGLSGNILGIRQYPDIGILKSSSSIDL